MLKRKRARTAEVGRKGVEKKGEREREYGRGRVG